MIDYNKPKPPTPEPSTGVKVATVGVLSVIGVMACVGVVSLFSDSESTPEPESTTVNTTEVKTVEAEAPVVTETIEVEAPVIETPIHTETIRPPQTQTQWAPPPPQYTYTPPPATYVPEVFPQQDTNVYYKNCKSVWNDIGGPIYRGNPGYGSHLDRDGDGKGCETRPNY